MRWTLSLDRSSKLHLLFFGLVAAFQMEAQSQDVLTHHNDIYRSGVYASETSLTPDNVRPNKRFGKIFARQILGQALGQPLYVRGVPVNGKPHNVVYIATAENMVYGFDADDRNINEQTAPLMKASFGAAAPIDHRNIFRTMAPSNGISSTPVIDLGNPANPAEGTLYVVAKLNGDGKFHIFALDLTSLAIRPNAQGKVTGVVVDASAPGQKPDGSKTTVSFNSSDHFNRPALLISMNHLVIAFGSGPNNDGDNQGFHGWVLSYSLPGLVQTGAYVTTPSTDTAMGAIWQGGNGPAADDQGNIYVMTGNGHVTSNRPLRDLPNSFVKLANSDGSLKLVDWYTPPSRDVLEACDLDLGSSGPAVIPSAAKVIGAGKSGILYVLNKDNMGKTDAPMSISASGTWRGAPDCKVGQCFRIAENEYEANSKQACNMNGFPFSGAGFNTSNWNVTLDSYPHIHGAPVVWKLGNNNINMYVWPEQDYLKAFHFDGREFSPNATGSSNPVKTAMMSMPGGTLSLSWNGKDSNTGVIWASRPNPAPSEYASAGPFISEFHDQQHYAFRDGNGSIWDAFYTSGSNTWNLQQINTNGNPAAGDVFVSVYNSGDQQHFAYPDIHGNIFDSFYTRGINKWQFQRINTQGHKVVGRIFVSTFHDQQHFAFRDTGGLIWDAYYVQTGDGWHFQQINTNGHPAGGDIFVSVYESGDQQHFAYPDANGNIFDSFYTRGINKWQFQQINTQGHKAVGRIFVSTFHDQQHFAFRDAGGLIWDAYYVQTGDGWHFQQINTNGHPAGGDIFVSVYESGDQQHFAYPDGRGNIFDSFYTRGINKWQFQQIDTYGHVPSGSIFVSVFFDQQHFAFRDRSGAIWDSFYVQTGNGWHSQRIKANVDCMYSRGNDLTPNDASCNAIDKIVRGYLEAFAAVPDGNGRLVELWNSEDDPEDSVEWFAKQSPPTIADGKVFLAEFPAKPPGLNWSLNNQFGRLIVYSLR